MGGVGEIGSNFTLVETENHRVYLDYGILFPYDDFFDINYLIVDLAEIKEDKEATLFITHGHEDHIGAVAHFIEKFPKTQIIAPEFAANLIRLKLEPKKLPCKIKVYDESDHFTYDQIELHPLHVTHSIPDTYGVILKDTSLDQSVLFISDFKFDLNPSFEKPFDTQKVKDLFTTAQKRICLLDSTNILNENKTASESDLLADFEYIFSKNKRTFITLFSSNIYRVKNIFELAKKHKKKITTIGRSVNRYLQAAQDSDLINLADYPVKDFDAVDNYQDSNLICVVTGSQGEHLGALRRILNGDQKNIHIDEDDLFVFSSKPIPGNEKKIYQLYNRIAELNAEMITNRDLLIHASGHPGQEDLKQLIDVAKPTHYIPIHGETYFLRKHIEFINKYYPHVQTLYLENFQGLDFSTLQEKFIGIGQKEPLLIHGDGHVIEREKISERRKMACNGVVMISINQKEQKVEITHAGLPILADQQNLKLKDHVHYLAFNELKKRDYDYKQEQIRIKVRNFYKALLGYKPQTYVHLL